MDEIEALDRGMFYLRIRKVKGAPQNKFTSCGL